MSLRRIAAASAAAGVLLAGATVPAQADPGKDLAAGLVKSRVELAKNTPCGLLQAGNLANKFDTYSDAAKSIREQAKGTSLTATETAKLATTYADRLLECGVVKPDLASGSSQFLGGSSDVLESFKGALGSS